MEDATLKQLRSLTAVDRHGSISAAARELHLTPQAVGQQIRLLERAAGVALIVRSPRGLTPTGAGRRVIDAAHNVELELAACRRDLNAMVSGLVGNVTIGVVSTAKYFAPYMVAAFRSAHKDISVDLIIGNRSDILRSMDDVNVDVYIMGRPPDHPPLVQHVIGPHPHLVVARPSHPLASEERIRWKSLANEPFLMRESSSGTRRIIDSLLARAGISPPIGMEIATNETIKQAVMAGLGIAFLSAHTTATELADGRLVALSVDGTPVMREWMVVRHEHVPLSPAAELVWTFLVEEGANHLPYVMY